MIAYFTALFALTAATPADSLLVSTSWLSQHLKDPNLVIVHLAMDRREYDKGHIPGARYSHPRAFFTSADPGVELPSVAAIDSALESLGISNSSRVVFYGDTWMAPRFFLAMDYVGMGDRTSLLDGGLVVWSQEKKPTVITTSTVSRSHFESHVRSDLIVDAAWVRQHLNDPAVALIDGRSEPEYNGTTDSERLPRFGHIPGAVLLPWEKTFTDGAAALDGNQSKLRSREELSALFHDAGATGDRQVVTYCTVGFRASHLYFVARLLGLHPKVYDGSMRDWSPREGFPVVHTGLPTRSSMVVPPRLLSEHLKDSNLVVLQAERSRAPYDSGHVAGARLVEFSSYAVTKNGLLSEVPEQSVLDALFRGLGISPNSEIVIYGDPLAAARLFFTLDHQGYGRQTALVDGGLAAWRAAGYLTTTEVPISRVGGYRAVPHPENIVDASWVKAHLDDTTVALLDARSPDEYAGLAPEEGVARPGHIPGAINIDWKTLFTEGSLKPVAEIRRMFAAAGVKEGQLVVTYCRVGTRSSMLYFVAHYLGYPVKMYDGSMNDWAQHPELPVVGPAKK